MTAIRGLARLGANPELKYVGEGKDKRPICELRLRFMNSKQDKESGEWIDQGFWADVNVWGRCAEPAAKMLSCGDRVYVDGNLVMTSWPDRNNEGQIVTGFNVDTSFVSPYFPDLDELSYKVRGNASPAQAEEGVEGAA